MKRKHILRRALTIEYAIVMMALVTAFVALILTTATLTTERAIEYRTYIERKAVLDEIGDAFIRKYVGGEENIDLQQIVDSDEDKATNNFYLTETQTELIVHRGSERSTIELHVVLELTQSEEGEALRVALYRYGV